MEVNDVLPISANPVQEGQEVARANREGGDTAAFAAMLYLILGTPQAGTGSTASEEVKPGETKASAAEVVPFQKGSSAPIASGAKFNGALTDGSTAKSAAVADASNASIGGGRVEPQAVIEINQNPIEALTAQASAHGKDLAAVNDAARVVRDPAASAPIGSTTDEVVTDPQAEPEQSYEQPVPTASTIGRDSAINAEERRRWNIERPPRAGAAQSDAQADLERRFAKFALAEGNVIRRFSVINIEAFDQAQGRPGTRNIERQGTASTIGRDSALNTEEPRTWNIERPPTAESIGQVAARGNFATHVEPELVTEPVGQKHPDLRSGGQLKLDITPGAAGSDSQVDPAQDSAKLAPATSAPIRLVHEAGKNSTPADVESVTGPAGEIHAGTELAGKFQFGKTTDGDGAEHEARLMAEAETKTDVPRAGRGPAQRLSDIAAPVPRADMAAEKFAPAGDPAPASWHSTVNRVADELASHVRLNKREAVIQLDPPELGKIKIEMHLEGEKLEARIVADVHESRVLIESHLQELRQALRSQHLDLADVRVSQDTGSGGSGDPMQGFRQQQPDGEPEWARNAESTAGAASAKSERSEGGNSRLEKGRVSMWA